MLLRQLADAQTLLPVAQNGFAVYDQRGTAQPPAFQFRPPQAGTNPLDNQRSFEFRNGGDDYDYSTTQGSRAVELFAIADELDIQMREFVQHLEKVRHRPCQPIARPDQQNIEFTFAGIGKQLIESGPVGPRAGNLVFVIIDDRKTALPGQLVVTNQAPANRRLGNAKPQTEPEPSCVLRRPTPELT